MKLELKETESPKSIYEEPACLPRVAPLFPSHLIEPQNSSSESEENRKVKRAIQTLDALMKEDETLRYIDARLIVATAVDVMLAPKGATESCKREIADFLYSNIEIESRSSRYPGRACERLATEIASRVIDEYSERRTTNQTYTFIAPDGASIEIKDGVIIRTPPTL